MKIYTKQGDKGLTRLGNGTQVRKDDLVIEALGSLDELNTALGYAVSQHKTNPQLLQSIQHSIFNIGAELCLSKSKYEAVEEDTKFLESTIDFLQADTPPLKNFILPGGNPASAWLHMCCAIARRAERAVVGELNSRLAQGFEINMLIVVFLNRVSDLLFCLARHENHSGGTADVLWNPQAKKG